MRERRGAYRALVERPEGKRPFGRPKRRKVNNIEMYIPEMLWKDMDCIDRVGVRNRRQAIVNVAVNFIT
jgi:hypothetical protein